MGGPGIALILGGHGGEEDDEYAEETDFQTLADDFERATGVKVKDPSLFASVIQRCCEFGEGELEEPEPAPRKGGKPSLKEVLG